MTCAVERVATALWGHDIDAAFTETSQAGWNRGDSRLCNGAEMWSFLFYKMCRTHGVAFVGCDVEFTGICGLGGCGR